MVVLRNHEPVYMTRFYRNPNLIILKYYMYIAHENSEFDYWGVAR